MPWLRLEQSTTQIQVSDVTARLPCLIKGCETWCPILREEYGLKELEVMVLKIIFGRKEGESVKRVEKTAQRGAYNMYE
jgi:hypothetical protein